MAGFKVLESVSWHSTVPVASLLSVVVLIVGVAEAAGLANLTCGLESGSCGQQCRQSTCEALLDFFQSTYSANETQYQSWATKDGWGEAIGRTCGEILRVPPPAPPAYCRWYGVVCCWETMISARRCTVLHTIVGLEIPVNGLTGNITTPQFVQVITRLHQCGLTQISLDDNALHGSLSSDWGRLANLTSLSMARNRISGTIPDGLRSMKRLMRLSLDGNAMHGTLPDWLGELTELRRLALGSMTGNRNTDGSVGLVGTIPRSLVNLTKLEALDLGQNSLTGTIPDGLCHSNILLFSLPNNKLAANLNQLLNCKKAARIDLSYNRITGTLPDAPHWELYSLAAISLNNNDINGTVPRAIFQLPSLAFLNMADNRLTGTIDKAVGQARVLNALMLQHNQLTGPLHENLWTLQNIDYINLQENQLTGTISSAVGGLAQLGDLALASNKLTGSIPAQIGYLNTLITVDLRNNSLRCDGCIKPNTSRGNTPSSEAAAGSKSRLLPCFLTHSQYTMPRRDGSNIACPVLYRKPRSEALQDCGDETQLGQQASHLPDLSFDAQLWYLDPSYYNYVGCVCVEGYDAVWEQEKLTCQPKANTSSLPEWVVPIIVVLSFVGCMVLAATALLVWLKMAVQLRMKWQREQELMKHKQLGVPSSGLATLVVTDIEQYSGLTQWNGPVAAEALATHNAILRKATAAHAGHVIEQEGDSWSVAFYSPMEALAFCLQVQQALHRSSWPQELKTFYASVSHATDIVCDERPGDHGSIAGSIVSRTSVIDATSKSSTHAGSIQFLRTIGSKLWPSQQSCPAEPPARHASCESMGAEGSVQLRRASVAGTHPKGGAFKGLRVRMGVASGTVVPEGAITRSTLFKLAKVVSDMANGGQVLLEAVTFAAICNRLTELGTVDHNGYNDSLASIVKGPVHNSRRTWWGRRLLARLLTGRTGNDTDVTVLDMGQYWLPDLMISVTGQSTDLQPINEGSSDMTSNTGASWMSASAGSLLSDGIAAPLGRAAVALVHCVRGRTAYQSLTLYSVHANALCARAKAWMNQLNAQAAAHKMARGYFEAPGTLLADIVPAKRLEIDRPPLVSVTIVFVALADADILARQKPGVAEAVHSALGSVMQALLMFMNDGYLCRQQEAVLRYMVAFREPTRAAEWCIMLQAVMQQLPWPPEILTTFAQGPGRHTATLLQKFKRSGSNDGGPSSGAQGKEGRLRPSLRIGFDEGRPNSIHPDHLGHADYFGSRVNSAARMMGIAASEDIVLSSDLAQRIFDTWRYQAELGGPRTAAAAVENTESSTPKAPHDPNLGEARTAAALPGFNLDLSANPMSAALARADNAVSCDANVTVVKQPITSAKSLTTGATEKPDTAHGSHIAHVSAYHIGTYAFKGCGEVDMVCLASSIQLGTPPQLRVAIKEAKGTLVTPNSGPVIGLQDCPVVLPDVLPALERAWTLAARQTHTGH